MRYAIRRHEQIAGAHGQLPSVEQETAFAFDDVVHLVHAGVRVQRVRLAGFEGVEADQQARRLKDGLLPILSGRHSACSAGLITSGCVTRG